MVDASESSQFLSALLLAAPCARGEVSIGWKQPVASFPYVRLTLSMMEEAGIDFRTSGGNGIVVPAPQVYSRAPADGRRGFFIRLLFLGGGSRHGRYGPHFATSEEERSG